MLTESEILRLANMVKIKRGLEERLRGFNNQKDFITVRWNNPHDRDSPNLPSYDSVEVPIDLVRGYILDVFSSQIAENDITRGYKQIKE
jgi:hypothetical protein